jgi:sec-independent protein translocase protein TatA
MNCLFALFDVGGGQIILILVLILIFFGAKRIPDLAKGLGQGIKEFKKATREVSDEIHNAANDQPAYTPPRPAPQQVPQTTASDQPAPANQTPETKVI